MKEKEVLENLTVVKRSGQRVSFNSVKIAIAIKQAFDSNEEDTNNEKKVNKVYNLVLNYIVSVYENRKTINVEDIQDIIENTLKKCGYHDVYKHFNEYRLQRAASREAFSVKEQHKFVKAIEKIGLSAKNYQKCMPIDLMISFGKTISQEFARAYLIESKYNRAHEEGRIYIEDIKSYALKTTASSIVDLSSISCNSINDFVLKIIDIVNGFKEEQYMEQTIMDLDIVFKKIILADFKDSIINNTIMFFKVVGLLEFIDISLLKEKINEEKTLNINVINYSDILLNEYSKNVFQKVYDFTINNIYDALDSGIRKILNYINNKTYKIANSKVNISLSSDDIFEANLFREIYFKILNEEKYKNVTTICKIDKDGSYLVDSIYNKNDLVMLFLNNNSYDDAIDCLSDQLIINKNVNGDEQTSRGRIKLSTVTINLARLGLKYNLENIDDFYKELEELLELSKNALLQRYELQSSLYKENYQTILNDGMLYDAKRLEDGKRIRKVLRNGTLNISFSGLMESCIALTKDNGNNSLLDLGIDIVSFMKKKVDEFSNDLKLNFTLSEENTELVNKHFLTLDKSMYGDLEVLKKDGYGSISDYINKLDDKNRYKYINKYQELCCFNLFLVVNRNKSKILDTINNANKSKVSVMRVIAK